MMRYIICLLFLILTIRSHGQDCDCVYPIIFVHGWAGSEYSWENFSNQIEPIWGDKIIIPDQSELGNSSGTVYYANLNFQYNETNIWGGNNIPDYPINQSTPSYFDDDVVVHEQFTNAPTLLPSKCVYAISFQTKKDPNFIAPILISKSHPLYDKESGVANTPDGESDSNESSAFKQGYALGRMIKKVLQITGKEKVILVAHSMGGLACREYLQRSENGGTTHKWWVDSLASDGHKVAKLFTVGTPHRGSNTADLSVSVIGAAGMNLRSEAVRDLRYQYSYLGINSGIPGLYLYGNSFYNETQIPTTLQFHNINVNCDEDPPTDNVLGLNHSPPNNPWNGTKDNPLMPLPVNLKYTYYVSDKLLTLTSLDPSSDGIVKAERQWLYSEDSSNKKIPEPLDLNITEEYVFSDKYVTESVAAHSGPLAVFLHLNIFQNLSMIKETDDFSQLIRGLDEADYPFFAGKIEPFRLYAGLAQKRADLVPESSSLSNNEFAGVDLSTITDNLKDGDWYKIQIDEPSDDLHLILIKQPDLLSRIDFFHNSTPDPYGNPPAENNFFQQSGIGEDPIIDLPLENLEIGTYYFRITHILSGNENETWKKPYKFMIGTSSQCRANLRYQSEDKTISTLGSEQEGVYYLIDTDRNIVTYDYAQSSDPGLARIDFDYDCYWENTTSLDVTTDVHWGLETAYDYLKDNWNYIYPNLITAFVNYAVIIKGKQAHSNAIAPLGQSLIKFGYGDAVYKKTLPIASLDVVAHEFFHLILDQLDKLNYIDKTESAALNEGFADIFGVIIENLANPEKKEDLWLIGEDFHLGPRKAWRSLKDPKSLLIGTANDSHAYTYGGNKWQNLEPHDRATVIGKWFQLLVEGGEGVNENENAYFIEGLGMQKASKIALKTVFDHLENLPNFNDVRLASLVVVKVLFGDCSFEENSLRNAWYAVGLGEPGIMVEKLELSPAACQVEDGDATILMIEGNTNYSFQWDNGQTGVTCTNLSKGDHEVTIIQSTGEGCELIYPFTVTEELSFTSTIKIKPNTNCDLPNGKATLSIKDQTTNSTPANLQIIWLDSENNDIGFQSTQLNDLSAGQYSVVIQDTDTGCTETLPFTIETKPIDIEIEGGGYRPFCEGKLPPQIKLYPFVKDCPSCEVVDWDTTDGIILEEASDLSEITIPVQNATYSLTMKDKNGCSATVFTSIQVDERDCSECADDSLEFISFTGIDPCKEFTVNVLQPIDPNEIIGPEGYGDPNWISINDEVPYTVLFENDPEFAMADARRVEIIHYFDDKANPATFRLSDFGFANLSFTVPANRSFYQARLDARDSLGVYVDVVAGIDVINNKAFWILEAIDPSTGQPPLAPDVGMLPINDSLTHKGEGYVNFSLHSIATAITGDTLLGQATILFDKNEPIETNIHYNVIDAVAPTSQIDSLPDLIDTTAFTISWIGADDPGGSGLKVYSLYVAENAGPYLLYQSNLIDTSLVFKGRKGDTYSFYTRAIDNTGNIEKPKPGVSVTIKDDLLLAAKVILQGPYDGGEQLMRDDLRVQGKIPLLEPYLDFGFVTATGQEKIDTSILLNIGPNAIIDWIFVELRNAKDYSIVEATRSALLQRDGDIVDLDGISPVIFFNLKPDEYFVVIRHRNHLGIRSSQPVSLSSIATSYDFTAVLSQAAGTTPLHDLGNGKFGLYAGNANFDAQINAVDKNTFWRVQNGQPYVYGISIADFNMDGTVNAVDKNSYWRINNSIVEQIE